MEAYLALAASAFLAATLLPMSSEAVLAALVAARGQPPWALFAVALAANTAGSAANWGLGRFLRHFQGRRWFPVSAQALQRAHDRFQRWGAWTLLFAWLPFVGDPLTVMAGVLRVDFRLFLALVGLGKALRYAAVVWLADGVAPP